MAFVLVQLDLLYEEAVYTVVNRVGVPSPEHVRSEEDLFAYLLKVPATPPRPPSKKQNLFPELHHVYH